ncbi:MAG: pentapeptide repeat-containing protein [Candidatus Omnitrophota bacterium]
MANPEQESILREGAEAWNAWREAHPDIVPDLRGVVCINVCLDGVNLSDANLREADFHESSLMNANLCGAELCDANMSRANLDGARLINADLSRIRLSEASLQRANLKKTNIVEADLRRLNLAEANLKEANLFVTNLAYSNLRKATLNEASIFETDLSGANLSEACLWGVECLGSNLTKANLTNADLWRCRFIRCDLSGAVVENAVVRELKTAELRGLPIPPALLRLDEEGKKVIIGKMVHAVFNQFDIVEIHLNLHLTDLEMICLQAHIAKLHQCQMASGIRLCGQRLEGSHTTLLFQADSYENIYDHLSLLLSLFPRSLAIDWQKTLAAIAEEEIRREILALVQRIPATPASTFCDHMAQVFMNFRNIVITAVKHAGKEPNVYLEIVQDIEKASQISIKKMPLSALPHFLIVPLNPQEEVFIADRDELARWLNADDVTDGG